MAHNRRFSGIGNRIGTGKKLLSHGYRVAAIILKALKSNNDLEWKI
jgi:hypothetical protein